MTTRMTTTKSDATYTPPKKVKKIEHVDRDAEVPTTFLARLRNDRARIQKGFMADVDAVEWLPLHTRFVCISDTHGQHDRLSLPAGDVLLHCGDFTKDGKLEEVFSFNNWLAKQPFQHKIVIAGACDLIYKELSVQTGVEEGQKKRKGPKLFPIPKRTEKEIKTVLLTNCTYLEDNEVTINGIRIWGSPWQPGDESRPFNLPRREEILKKWNKIPGDGIDILMTRGPPAGHRDKDRNGTNVGCVDLLNSVQLRIQPKYHVFGLIHEASGITTDHLTTYINCSVVNDDYNLVKPPVIFDFPNGP